MCGLPDQHQHNCGRCGEGGLAAEEECENARANPGIRNASHSHHSSITQVLKANTQEKLRASFTKVFQAHATGELRAHGPQHARRARPLTADTDLATYARGPGTTLAKSVQLVRSALAQLMRSARESFATCRGALSTYRSTGNSSLNRQA